MAFKTSEKYKSVIYSGDCRHKLKLLFNGVELEDADVYCESLKVTSRILPNGSTRFSLDNFVAKEAEIILHDIDTTIIQSPVNISIGTLVDGTYEYVPIGLFVVQDLPTTDKNKTTIKLRDYAVKFDFGYNAKDIIDENGGSVTKLQILQDICNKAGVETDITKFYGSNSKIGIYDNSITARTYISYLAEQAGAIATIDRSGKLIFVQLKDLETVEIPLNIVEKYEDGEKYEISRVVYEDAIRKFEYGDESKDTLFINTANPYIDNEVLTGTLSGSKIETSDSADDEVVNYKQYGITKQETTIGKNLLDTDILSYSFEANTNGFVQGGNIGFGKVTLNANTKYYISYDVVETGTTNLRNTAMLVASDGKGSEYQYQALGNHNTTTGRKVWEFTPALTKEYIVNYWCNTSNKKVTIANMMVSTDSDTDYEPYTGGQPSPSPDYPQEIEVATGSVSVKSTGKNLFDKNNGTTSGATKVVNGEKISITGQNGFSLFYWDFDVSNINQIVMSGKIVSGNYAKVYLTLDGIAKRAAEAIGDFSYTLDTTSNTTARLYLYANKGQTIEQPTTSVYENIIISANGGDYEPYKESSITYNLGDNFLADKDYIENGVLNKKIGKVVLDGSENWGKDVNLDNDVDYFYIWNTGIDSNNIKTAISNRFILGNRSTQGIWATTVFCITINKKYTGITSSDTKEQRIVKFKTWLSENPVTVYYELATPEQIQLETTGELRTFEPNTIITNSLDSEMEVEYTRNQTQVSQILELNKDIPLNSFKTGKIIGNPAIDAYDIIKIVDGDKEFKTLATNDLTYNGVMINTFDTQIGKEAKKENVTLTPEATFKKWAKTEIDNVEAEVRINTGNIQTVKDEMGNMYTKGQVNELVANAETGVTNTFSEAGGNNILRNTGLWFESNDTDNPYEFWLGKAKRGDNDNATNYKTILLQNGSFIQEQEVPNGNYSISFWYKKLISQSVASVVINDKEYQLDSTDYKQFYTGEQNSETNEYITEPIVVTSGHINIKFKCDADNGVEVYDLMCNKGSVKLAYSQNQNETTTDTVNISKGITITSSNDENVKFKADYDGIRILNKNGDVKTRFTDKGMETDEAIIRYKEQTCGTLIQEVGEQTWFTRM